MSKYIDKLNLPQYKYFNNVLEQTEKWKELIADCLTTTCLLEYRKGSEEYRNGLRFLKKVRRRLPAFLYVLDEDINRCKSEISVSNVKTSVKKIEKYAGILCVLDYFQGSSVMLRDYLEESDIGDLSKSQLRKIYQYDQKEDRYYEIITSIPKLVLINDELYRQYLMREFSEKEFKKLDDLMPKDVHFIVAVQNEIQKETAYIVAKEDNELIIRCLERHETTRTWISVSALSDKPDLTAVLLSLLDYLLEIKKSEDIRHSYSRDTESPSGSKDWVRCQKYVDKNSIKVYDMKNTAELDVYRFSKKRGRLGTRRRCGYEMVPHTRKSHYRKCKNGKIVRVRSSIIHKERYEGIQSAHRINEKKE